MKNILDFIRRERLYFLLIVFILMVNTVVIYYPGRKAGGQKASIAQKSVKADKDLPGKVLDEFSLSPEETAKIVSQKKDLAFLLSISALLILLVLLSGLLIDSILVCMKLVGRSIDIRSQDPGRALWNIWDVARVAILFFFLGYMATIIESFLVREFRFLKNDNLRMIINSSILDTLSVIFILYFTVGQYKEKLTSLGISFKNFFRNVAYGIAGYIAAVPAFIFVLLITLIVINITKYVPERQAVVELFMKEKNAPFLIYTSFFASVIGPIIEELFFRGFMYGALKKYTGIFWATMITATVFASLHANLAGFLPIMVLGILLAYLYEKTGTLVSSITVHIIHNFSMVYFVFLIKQLRT